MKSIIDWLLANPGALLSAVVLLVASLKGPLYLKAYLSTRRVRLVLEAARIAFGAVQEIARLTPGTSADDKAALFLANLTDALLAMGEEPASPLEGAMAQKAANGWHAETKARPILASPG